MRALAICGIISLFGECLMATDALKVTDEHFQEAVNLLGDLVAIPSVSHPKSPDYNMDHMKKTVRFIEGKLQSLGCTVSCPSIDDSAPFVIAELGKNPSKPTILLYAHYDVQPVQRDKWHTDPFVMQEKDGRLYGRGASDDKAGIVSIIAAIETYQKEGREIPVNIKLLFEGEEEYGSTHMKPLLEQKQKELQADALVILDGLNRDVDNGSLTSSTRGLTILSLKVKALEKPVHSGIGCLAPDPAQALAGLIYMLRDPKNIPEFMDSAQLLKNEEREILAKSSQSAESYAREMGVLQNAKLRGDPQESVYERIVQEPSISVINMNCGEPNGANSIQDYASCTIGIRVTPGQDPNKIADVVIRYLKSQAVMYDLPIEVKVEKRNSWAWKGDLSKPYSRMYLEALGENFPHSSATPCGGALPLLRDFEEVFPNMEMLIPAVEDPHTAAHSHNESQDISVFRNSINSLISFFEKAGCR